MEEIDMGAFLQWEATTRDVIDFKKIYVDMADGDVLAGLILSEIVYWFLPTKDDKSKLRVKKEDKMWLAVRYKDWWERTRMTPSQAERAVNKLVDLDIIEKQLFKYGGTPTVHLRLNDAIFLRLWQYFVEYPPESQEDISTRDRNEFLFKQKSTSVKTEINLGLNRNLLTETTDTEIIDSDSEREGEEEISETSQDELLDDFRSKQTITKVTNRNKGLTAEDYKKRIEQTMIRGAQRFASTEKNPEIESYLYSLLPHVRPLATRFCYAFGRKPTKKEDAYWRKAWEDQFEMGITHNEIKEAFEKMRHDGLTIKSPESVTAIAYDIKMKAKAEPATGATEIWKDGKRVL